MSAPTLEQVNLVNTCINNAVELQTAFGDLQALMTYLTFNADVLESLAAADFSDPSTPGPLHGFDPAKITAFVAAVQSIAANATANNNANAIAVAVLARSMWGVGRCG
jgi:hypothetical protein